jgi:hypothetical protein
MGKLCKNQRETLIGKLVALFSGVSADEINEVVDATKNRERLETFDGQIKTLIDKGYPEAAGMEKDQFLGYMNPLRDKFEIGDIIVIPERIVSIPKQMSLVKLNGKTGYTYLNLGVLRQADGVETPNVPYLIRDVENGAAMRNTSSDNCVKQFEKQGRFGLVTEEGIAIVTHKPETLNDHYIDLPGSRYDSGNVPLLWLHGGRPRLCFGWAAGADSEWGSASCGSRIRA